MSEARQPSESELHSYADGRVDPEQKVAIERWLAEHPDDAERVDAYRRLGESLRALYDPVLEENVPGRLMRSAGARRPWVGFARAAAWLAIGLGVGALAGWQLHEWRTPLPMATDSAAVMARRAALAHATYSPEVRHPVEVGADQEQHLVTWLSKRLGTKVRAPRLDEVGMTLVGGRLLPGESGPVAQFMYQTPAGRRITLYVRAEARGHRETAFRYARENNVSVFYWIDGDCGYALASADLTKDELLRIATLVYKQFES
jgi:anti-sigma factor RsiW